MAKKKSKKKTTRRRRMGAVALNPNSQIVQFGSIAAGFLFANQINGAIDKVAGDKLDSKIIAGAQVGLGALLVFKKGGKKNLIVTLAAGALAGAGAKRALAAFGLGSVGGYQMVPSIGGYQSVPAIGAGVKRMGGYTPGPGGINGYATARQAVGGLMNSGGGDLMEC